MLDLSSILLHLGVGVKFKPSKRTLVRYLDKVLPHKLNIQGLAICVPVFFSLSSFDIPFVVVLALFSQHFLQWQYLLFLHNLCGFFCCFFLIVLSLSLCSLLPASVEMGYSLNKNFLYHCLLFQLRLQFLRSMFSNLSRLKPLLVYLIHDFDDCCLFV